MGAMHDSISNRTTTKYPTNRWKGLKGGEMKWYYDRMGD